MYSTSKGAQGPTLENSSIFQPIAIEKTLASILQATYRSFLFIFPTKPLSRSIPLGMYRLSPFLSHPFLVSVSKNESTSTVRRSPAGVVTPTSPALGS